MYCISFINICINLLVVCSLCSCAPAIDLSVKDISTEEVKEILYVFFPFMFGIYPYAEVTDKQRKAMEEAGVEYNYHSIYEITYNCLIMLLDK